MSSEGGVAKSHLRGMVEGECTGHILQLSQCGVQWVGFGGQVWSLQVCQREKQLHNRLNLICDLFISQNKNIKTNPAYISCPVLNLFSYSVCRDDDTKTGFAAIISSVLAMPKDYVILLNAYRLKTHPLFVLTPARPAFILLLQFIHLSFEFETASPR